MWVLSCDVSLVFVVCVFYRVHSGNSKWTSLPVSFLYTAVKVSVCKIKIQEKYTKIIISYLSIMLVRLIGALSSTGKRNSQQGAFFSHMTDTMGQQITLHFIRTSVVPSYFVCLPCVRILVSSTCLRWLVWTLSNIEIRCDVTSDRSPFVCVIFKHAHISPLFHTFATISYVLRLLAWSRASNLLKETSHLISTLDKVYAHMISWMQIRHRQKKKLLSSFMLHHWRSLDEKVKSWSYAYPQERT